MRGPYPRVPTTRMSTVSESLISTSAGLPGCSLASVASLESTRATCSISVRFRLRVDRRVELREVGRHLTAVVQPVERLDHLRHPQRGRQGEGEFFCGPKRGVAVLGRPVGAPDDRPRRDRVGSVAERHDGDRTRRPVQQSLGGASRHDPSEPAGVARAHHDDACVLLLGELLKRVSGRRGRYEWTQLDVVDVIECGDETRKRASRVLAYDNLMGLPAWTKRL